MLKKIILIVVAALMLPITAQASYMVFGFTEAGGMTENKNQYYFGVDDTVMVDSKEATKSIYYEELYAGSELYLPVFLFDKTAPGGHKPVTDKMLKSDELTFSYTIMRGANYVGAINFVDTKKLKIEGLDGGTYVHIPLIKDYSLDGGSRITIKFVLSAHGITYEFTQATLECQIVNRVVEIHRDTIYGAKTPTIFKSVANYAGNATFDFGNDVKYTGKLEKKGTYYMNLSKEPNEKIKSMNPDAYLEFYNFLGKNKDFANTGKLEIPIDVSKLSVKDEAPSLYVYRIDYGELTALGAGIISFNKRTNRLNINTDSLENYVISNKPLLKDIDETHSDNILKTGYASPESSSSSGSSSSGTSKAVASKASASKAASSKASSSKSASASSSSKASSSKSASSAASSSKPASSSKSATSTGENADGYVPEEDPVAIANDNMSMGIPINATNTSAENPNTADAPIIPAIVAGSFAAISALVTFLGKKKRV